MTKKVIVLIAAAGGMASRKQNPHLPTQPGDIARDVYDRYDAEASLGLATPFVSFNHLSFP